jgi:hypothetical protein
MVDPLAARQPLRWIPKPTAQKHPFFGNLTQKSLV